MWAKVDDRLHAHSKARRAREAMALWVLALSWSCAELTDGRVPSDMPELLIPGGDAMAERLVSVGLWERTEAGFRFHDWAEYQPSAEEERAKREAGAAIRKARAAKAASARWSPDARKHAPSMLQASAKHAPSIATTMLQASATDACAMLGDAPVPVPDPEEEKEEDTSGSRPTASPSKVDSDDVRRVFEHWRTKLGHERAVLDDKRRRKIIAALKSHGLETALRAIDGCAASDFHMGRDERSGGKRFDDLELILRNASKIESFAALAPKAPAPQAKGTAPQRNWLDEWPEHVRRDGPKWTPPSPNRGGNRDGA